MLAKKEKNYELRTMNYDFFFLSLQHNNIINAIRYEGKNAFSDFYFGICCFSG